MTGVFGVVLGQILLMFLYLIIGYVLCRTGLITQEGSKALAHLLLYCVLPGASHAGAGAGALPLWQRCQHDRCPEAVF